MAQIENAPLVFINRVAKHKPENIRHTEGYCPFCHPETLTDVLREDGERIWLVNKYRTLADTMQTIVVESADHEGDFSNYTPAESEVVLRFSLECWGQMLRDARYRSILMYKNYGPLSGGSIRHPHLQIVGLTEKDGYERVPANAFGGVEVVREGGREVCLSTHPLMGFMETNASVPETGDAALMAPGDVVWLSGVIRKVVRYLLERYHGHGCTSYNLFFYRTEDTGAADGSGAVDGGTGAADGSGAVDGGTPAHRIVAKIVPRWVASPYFVGYRISQVDCDETLQAVAAEMREVLPEG